MEYPKGSIAFKNGIDKLEYLLSHREQVAKAIGVSADDIFRNRRNVRHMEEYISLMEGKYEFGDVSKKM